MFDGNREEKSHLAIHNLNELGLQRSTTHQETINILLADEVIAVLGVHRASVNDTDLLSHGGRHRRSHEGTNGSVRLLSLIGRRHLARSNSPHRLVRNHNVIPVLLLQKIHHSLQLSLADVHRLSALPVLQKLTDAQDHLDSVRQSHLHLLSNELVGFGSHGVTTLAVTQDRPVNTEVYDSFKEHTKTLQHGSRELAGVRSISLHSHRYRTHYIDLPDVLSSDLNLGTNHILHKANVKSSGGDNNIAVRLQLSGTVEGVDKISKGSLRSVLDT